MENGVVISKLRIRVTNWLLLMRSLMIVLFVVITCFERVMMCLNYCVRH